MNSEFSFSETSCLTKAEEPSLPYYLPIARGRIIGFIPFPIVLVLCEMQSVSSRIWTHVAVSISYDDNHYTMGTSILEILYVRIWMLYTAPNWPSRLGLQITPTASLQKSKTPSMSVLDMTLNDQMVRLQ